MKRWLIFKLCLYYIIGLISFSIIAYSIHRILIAILFQTTINPLQEIYNIPNILSYYSIWYLSTYTILYFLLLYLTRKYDKYTVKKLNEKLVKTKGGNQYGKR